MAESQIKTSYCPHHPDHRHGLGDSNKCVCGYVQPSQQTEATEVDFSAHDLRVTAGAIADDTARHIIQRAATVLAKRETEIERLRSLVKHCWIHSGYQNCGYAQMTTEQKALYDSIVSKEIK